MIRVDSRESRRNRLYLPALSSSDLRCLRISLMSVAPFANHLGGGLEVVSRIAASIWGGAAGDLLDVCSASFTSPPLWVEIHCRMSSARHAVTRSDNFTGSGNVRAWTRRQRVDLEIGTNASTCG